MAYNNPAMYYGNMYGNAYGNQSGYMQPVQNQTPQQMSNQAAQTGIIWVDGEIGAKAYQMPPGWPANTPLPMWDTNDTIIYLKSTNQLGMPNPLQKIHYTMEETSAKHSGLERLGSGDMSEYVKKSDLDRVRDEMIKAIQDAQTASGKEARK